MTTSRDGAAENFLGRLSDPERYPDKALAPYKEFTLGRKTYCFAPGGFLYRKDRGAEAVMFWVHVDIGDHLGDKTPRGGPRRENGSW